MRIAVNVSGETRNIAIPQDRIEVGPARVVGPIENFFTDRAYEDRSLHSTSGLGIMASAELRQRLA